jgi:uroporphyrinogen-III decarboxylase
MARETMTPTERMMAVQNLEKPDRVPVMPAVTNEANAPLTGHTQAEVCSDSKLALEICFEVFDSYGGWDSAATVIMGPRALQATGLYPMKIRIPGMDLPDDYVFQLLEEEIFKPEDYDKLYEMGFNGFYFQDYLWRVATFRPDEMAGIIEEVKTYGALFMQESFKRNLAVTGSGFFMHPFFLLSLMRSMVKFTEDLYYNPDIVERVLQKLTNDVIEANIALVRQTGLKGLCIVEERASAFYYPLSVFEKFWWPYTKQMVEVFWEEGIHTSFHLDTPWDKNLPYFKELPRGSYTLGLDSTTDIFAAKELLRGHGILFGDVSASLLSIGTPQDVETYVKKLIDEVGDDGGFMLGVGCSAPSNIKPENLRALVETGKNYEFSKT